MTGGRSRTAPRHPPASARDPEGPGAIDTADRRPGADRRPVRISDPRPIVAAGGLPAALADATAAAVADLDALGLGAGDRIALDAPARARWTVLPSLLAADRLGAASLVVDPCWAERERASVLADAAARVVATDRPAPPLPDHPDAAPFPLPDHPDDVPFPLPDHPDDVPFLLPTTSGSTGRPSVLARTRRSWRIGFDVLGPLPGPVLVPGPPSSTLYLFGALHALHHGLGLVTRDRFDPADLPAGGTVHLVPALLSALLDDRERRPGAPAPRVIVCGGAHVAQAVRERCARLLPDTTLIEYYGSAEHSLIALRRSVDAGSACAPPGGGPLRPVDGVRVELRDGVLWVDSPQAVLGRLRGGVLEPAGPGPTTVGDRAELAADGSLTVLGRAAATISSGGSLVAAEEVEQVLRAVPGVADVVVAGTPHPSLGMLVTAVVETGDGGSATRRALRDAARAALSPARRPRRWLVTTALPRLGSGKPARAAVDAGLRDGTLPARPFADRPGGRPGTRDHGGERRGPPDGPGRPRTGETPADGSR